ncbi:MAG: hypothetical protein HY319_28005 [Armatimonadetes bacterium]|nr:hypothetical protein [Armatimonadota bacterium]
MSKKLDRILGAIRALRSEVNVLRDQTRSDFEFMVSALSDVSGRLGQVGQRFGQMDTQLLQTLDFVEEGLLDGARQDQDLQAQLADLRARVEALERRPPAA